MTPIIAMKIARGTVRAGSHHLAARHERRFDAEKGEDQHRRRARDVAGGRRRRPGEILAVHRRDADDEQHDERQQLGDRHHRVEPIRAAHAGDVERREPEQDHGERGGARRVPPQAPEPARRARRRRRTRPPPSPR